MILAELDSPLIQLPWVSETYSGFIVSQPPYSDTPALEDWHYGDGANFYPLWTEIGVISHKNRGLRRMSMFYQKNTKIYWREKCGLCHEVDSKGCVIPADCPPIIW